jgi:hypothetical protein
MEYYSGGGKMKRGFLPPIPIEFFGPEDFDTLNIFKIFFFSEEDERKNYLSTIKEDEKNLPYFSRMVIGIVREKIIREVWLPEPCFISLLRPISKTLEDDGVKVVAFKYPPIKNSEFLKRSIYDSLKYLGISESDLENRLVAWNTIRNSLKKVDGVQVRSLALKSYTYIESFHTILDPSLSFPQLRNIAEKRIALNIYSNKKEPTLRLATFEFTPVEKGFYSVLDKTGGAIVYDEFSLESFPLNHLSDITYLYSTVSYPLGIMARKDKLQKEVKERGIEAVIYCTYNASEIKSNADFLEREIKIPIHIFELSDKEEKNQFEEALLERFLKRITDKRG